MKNDLNMNNNRDLNVKDYERWFVELKTVKYKQVENQQLMVNSQLSSAFE